MTNVPMPVYKRMRTRLTNERDEARATVAVLGSVAGLARDDALRVLGAAAMLVGCYDEAERIAAALKEEH